MRRSRIAGQPALYHLVWWFVAAILLSVCFLGYVYLASLVAQRHVPAESVRQLQISLVLYARIVLFKGLLPQLILASLLWPLLDRLCGFERRGGLAVPAGLVLAAAVAAAVVIPAVMTADLPNLPPVKFRGVGNLVATFLQMTAAVSAALWLPRWWLGPPGRIVKAPLSPAPGLSTDA